MPRLGTRSAVDGKARYSTLTRWVVLLLFFAPAFSAPPDYSSFGREQKISHNPSAGDLLRIWVVYVDQGDGMGGSLGP